MTDIEAVVRDIEKINSWADSRGIQIGEKLEKTIQAIRELQEQIPKYHLVADGDLPTNDDNRFYLCISENHEDDLPTMYQYDADLGFGWWVDIYDEHTLGFKDSEFRTIEEEHLENVIAWMEIPKF